LPEDSIRAVIFDIGQVIVRVDVPRAAEALGRPAGLTARHVLDAVERDARLRDFQEGRLTPREWHAHLAQRFGFPYTLEEFRTIWNSALDPTPLLEESLFADLGRRFRLVLLSNTDPLHVTHMEESFGFVKHFPARVYSCSVGVSKPHAEIYRKALAGAGASAANVLYVDDVLEYVEAGRAAGLEAVRFTDREQLLSELRRRGLLG